MKKRLTPKEAELKVYLSRGKTPASLAWIAASASLVFLIFVIALVSTDKGNDYILLMTSFVITFVCIMLLYATGAIIYLLRDIKIEIRKLNKTT